MRNNGYLNTLPASQRSSAAWTLNRMAVDWNEIRAEGSTESGGRFDFSI